MCPRHFHGDIWTLACSFAFVASEDHTERVYDCLILIVRNQWKEGIEKVFMLK